MSPPTVAAVRAHEEAYPGIAGLWLVAAAEANSTPEFMWLTVDDGCILTRDSRGSWELLEDAAPELFDERFAWTPCTRTGVPVAHFELHAKVAEQFGRHHTASNADILHDLVNLKTRSAMAYDAWQEERARRRKATSWARAWKHLAKFCWTEHAWLTHELEGARMLAAELRRQLHCLRNWEDPDGEEARKYVGFDLLHAQRRNEADNGAPPALDDAAEGFRDAAQYVDVCLAEVLEGKPVHDQLALDLSAVMRSVADIMRAMSAETREEDAQ